MIAINLYDNKANYIQKYLYHFLLITFVIVLHITIMLKNLKTKQHQINLLNDNMKAIASSFPDDKENTEKNFRLIDQVITSLYEIAQKIPEDIQITSISLINKDIILKGKAYSYNSLVDFINQIVSAELIETESIKNPQEFLSFKMKIAMNIPA